MIWSNWYESPMDRFRFFQLVSGGASGDVKDENGKVTNWAFSGGAPGQLMRRGITRDVIQPGMVVVVDGFHAKDGSNNGSGGRVTFADGRSVFTAGAEDKLPDNKK